MSMSLEQIEAEVLKLPEASRAELLTHIMESMQNVAVDGVADAWAVEAVNRDKVMENDLTQTLSAEDVFNKINLKDRDNEKDFIQS